MSCWLKGHGGPKTYKNVNKKLWLRQFNDKDAMMFGMLTVYSEKNSKPISKLIATELNDCLKNSSDIKDG